MSREFYVPCQPYAYPIRSRLSSVGVGGRLKSLVKWRNAREAAAAATEFSTNLSLPPLSLGEPIARDPLELSPLSDITENNSSNETITSHIQSHENESGAPHNLIESNLVSSSFDPGTSSFMTANSVLSFPTGEFMNGSNESNTLTRGGEMSSMTEFSNIDTVSGEMSVGSEEYFTNNSQPSGIPSAIIGVQIQASELLQRGAGILDVVPILYIQRGALNSSSNARSTTTEESYGTTSSGSEYGSSSVGDSGGDGSSVVLEMLAMMNATAAALARRNDGEFARSYYDPSCGSGASEGVVSVNGVVGGMDCMPLRPGPFHYLISEQAKSLVALQELQNEVGALLEFRDLVIETFPNLRHKMAVTAAASAATEASSANGNGTASVLMSSSQGSHIPLPLSSQSPSSRRIGEWEPGKVRRRVAQSRGENESSSSSLPRSRSNSHSGGNKHSATVQDSGFSTETSSKDSASTAIPRPQSPNGRPQQLDEAEDELWNLLDVIHRKGVRLREEVESLQGRLESVAPEELDVPSDILDAVRKVTRHEHDEDDDEDEDDDVLVDSERHRERRHRHQLRHHQQHDQLTDGELDSRDGELLLDEPSQLALLRREKLQLLDKVAELEAETISSRARAQELQAELAALSELRSGLEDRLRAGIEGSDATAAAVAAGILAPGAQRIQPIEPTTSSSALQSPRASGTTLNMGGKDSAFASVSAAGNGKTQKNRFRTRTIEKNVLANVATASSVPTSRSTEDVHQAVATTTDERRARLGALDSILVSPTRVPPKLRRQEIDAHKIAAILRERSPLELQRHLITTTVHNQVLQKRLDEVEKSSETLSERLGKAHEENEDLRFQLAERNIELEGTRARVRVLERLQQRPVTENDADDESDPQPLQNHHPTLSVLESTINGGGSSSTESSREPVTPGSGTESSGQLKPSPRRRPSRIPLLGATKPTAPKPPSSVGTPTSAGHRRNDSRDSLKSLSQKSGAPSMSSAGRPATARPSGRDSSRESLTKSAGSLSKPVVRAQEPGSRSLPRNNSLGKPQSQPCAPNNSIASRTTRDSIDSNGTSGGQTPSTPPRRPPAPARRSQSQTARPQQQPPSGAESAADSSAKSMLSSNPPSSWFSSGGSLYPDSLNSSSNKRQDGYVEEDEDDEEMSSRTGSTRVEFMIGSPTRKRLFKTPWALPAAYLDSMDTAAVLTSDDYQPDRGEALAELDSLECDERLGSEC